MKMRITVQPHPPMGQLPIRPIPKSVPKVAPEAAQEAVALLPAFFAFYAGEFDWRTEAVSVRLGRRARRRARPPQDGSAASGSSAGLCVEDPVEPEVDLASPYLDDLRDAQLRKELVRAATLLCDRSHCCAAWEALLRARKSDLLILPHIRSAGMTPQQLHSMFFVQVPHGPGATKPPARRS